MNFTNAAPVDVITAYGLIALSGIYIILTVTAVIVLIIQRNARIIAVRSPTLLSLAILYGTFTVCASCACYIYGKSEAMCTLLSVTYTLFLPMYCLPYLLMFPSIVFENMFNNLKVQRASGEHNWRWKLRNLFSTKSKLIFVLVVTAIQVAICLLLRRYAPVIPGGEDGRSPGLIEGDNCFRSSLIAISATIIFYLLALGLFAMRATFIHDPYYVRFELVLTTIALCPFILITIIYPIAPQIFPINFDFRWVPIVASMTGFSIGVWPILVISFERVEVWLDDTLWNLQNRLRGTNAVAFEMENNANGVILALSQGVDIFKAVLENPILLSAFRDFTVKIWSVENVLFYSEVEQFKERYKEDSAQVRLERACAIVNEFVAMGSPLEINIDYNLRVSLVKMVKEGKLADDLFDKAQKAIYELMKKDSFEKWQRTPDYRLALEKAVKKNRSSRSFDRNLQQQPLERISSKMSVPLAVTGSHESINDAIHMNSDYGSGDW